jgi:hypothetical protein
MYAGEDTQLRAVELESRVLLHSATALEHHIQHVLEPALVTLEHERDSTMRTVEMQRGALAAAQFESTALRKSWSWRITKPMRLALDLLSRIRKS